MEEMTFVPISEQLSLNEATSYYVQFLFGYVYGAFYIKDRKFLSPDLVDNVKRLEKEHGYNQLPKRYTLIFGLDQEFFWFLFSDNNLQKVIAHERNLVDKLKHGEEIELIDYTKRSKALRLSATSMSWDYGV